MIATKFTTGHWTSTDPGDLKTAKLSIHRMQIPEKWRINYYIYLDYSEKLVGFIIVENKEIQDILPKIARLHHYKEIKHKKAYIQSIKKIIEKGQLKNHLLKCKIKELKDNLSVFIEIIEFIRKHDYCKIFASIDDNQFNSFSRLMDIVEHKNHVVLSKESELRKSSVEYKLSLIIDTLLNIERMSK